MAIGRLVGQADRLALDGDASLTLDIHRVEDLVLEVACADDPTALDEPVGQRRFTMVDVGDNREIADLRHF